MGTRRLLRPALVTMALLAPARPAAPWGCQGHQVIALLAERHLTAPARQSVADLIGHPEAVIDVPRHCRTVGLSSIATVSTWADDVRGSPRPQGRPETSPWHFLDIPRGTSSTGVQRFCPPEGCVTSALAAQLAILASPRAPHRVRAEALMYVIHLVGDVHQPLHLATNHDRGGNCVPVEFFGTRPRPDPRSHHGDWTPNLHHVWDTLLLERAMGRQSVARYARGLDLRFADRLAGWQRGTPRQWARESHRLADAVAYGGLPTPLPTEAGDVARCDENGTAEHWRSFHERLGEAYQAIAQRPMEEQLVKAGARLAMLLNTTLVPPAGAHPGSPGLR